MVKGLWYEGYQHEKLMEALGCHKDMYNHMLDIKEHMYKGFFKESIVLFDDEIPVGFGIMFSKDLVYRVAVLVVFEEFRSQSFGDFMIRVMVRRAFDHSALEVYADGVNKTSEDFFKGRQFTEIEDSHGYKMFNQEEEYSLVKKNDFSCSCHGGCSLN